MTRTRNKPSGGGGVTVAVADSSHYVTNTTATTGNNHHHHGQHHHHGHHHHHHDGHHGHHHHHGGHNGGSRNIIIDPATLLARGYTGRYLGLTSTSTSQSSSIIKALSTNEIERDLRHMQAYHEAATRYHILTYTATNRVALLQQQQLQQAQMDAVNNGGGGAIIVGVSSHPLVPTDLSVLPSGTGPTSNILPLPIRIDPEHEKRVIAEKKRIQHAEAIREELEQQYVSLMRHYILTTQQLQNSVQQSELRTTQFLQPTIETYSKALGLQRTRLQMARDVLGAMKLRTTAIVEADVAAANNNQKAAGGGGLGAGGMSTTTTTSIMSDPTQFAAGADTCPLITTWYGVEEEWKKLYNNTTNNNNKKSKGSNKADGTTSILPWPCTVEPVTAPGVPQLVSCMSTAPDKSIALQAGNKNHKKQGGAPFGATSSSSLTWIESHLPKITTTGGGGSGQKETETTTLAELRGQVRSLQAELDSERDKNQKLLTATGKARGLQDEWVAMISLVRQETEAVLHRHNVLLESEEVREAVAHAEEQRKRQKTQEQQQQQPQPPAAVDEQQPPAPPHPDGGGGRKEEGEQDPSAIVATAGQDGTAPVAATTATRPTAAESSTGRNNDDEGANEADDEGMVEEGEEVDDSWETGNNNNKRSAGEQGTSSSPSPPSNRKRRKL